MRLRLIITYLTTVCLAVAMVTAVQAATSKVTANNNLRLYGAAFNPNGYFTIQDNAVVTGKLNVKGNVSDSNGTLTLDDTVAVAGNLIVEGDSEIKGEIYNSNDAVTVNDDLSVAGLLSLNTMVTPTAASCATDGGLSYDSNYLYICVAGAWKKVALSNL